MLTIYPSNHLEDLAYLLDAVVQTSSNSVLQPQTILVENRGMQHWVSMQLARFRGIAMNLEFRLPAGYLWELSRKILSNEQIPQENPYSREVLAWRIDALMSSESFLASEGSELINQYWGAASPAEDSLRRYQLAHRIGDLFEQYIIYRPDWLREWEQGEMPIGHHDERWQSALWRALVQQAPWHPARVQAEALQRLPSVGEMLPQHTLLFAINTMPPTVLDYLSQISNIQHVHFFHLNPCVEYWGDQATDKSIARRMRSNQWRAWAESSQFDLRNPLLANYGEQGRDFFNQLQMLQGSEVRAFEDDLFDSAESGARSRVGRSLLQQVQDDILLLRDARQHALKGEVDGSIEVVSAHSSLREVQGLHDFLLHKMNQPGRDLEPKDVLVMCPAIEKYAHQIEAVFRKPSDSFDPANPRLPCSISDRTLKDSEPMVAAFTELLALPDSRFTLSSIVDLLQLPSVMRRFNIDDEELKTLHWWLAEANIRWGLDAVHRQRIAGIGQHPERYSWEWGLSRLLTGFAWGDEEHVFGELLLMRHVEGKSAVALGKLIHLLEVLRGHFHNLALPRSAGEWREYLLDLKEQLFRAEKEEQEADLLITLAIDNLLKHCDAAEYTEAIDLPTVRYVLNQYFSQPETGNAFLNGQVTFCSMVPMRSIPFKVIAVLGLNDGDYPRQNNPPSFDLMSQGGKRPGDRSRKGDDRYLFLEAIVSARETLYLSYQGRDAKRNAERQPSILLTEFLEYLRDGYAMDIEPERDDTAEGEVQNSENGTGSGSGCERRLVTQLPLQPFSTQAYVGSQRSFDQGWHSLIEPKPPLNNLVTIPSAEESSALTIDNLVSFFEDPLKDFSRSRLNLVFSDDNSAPEDHDPFTLDNLENYQLRNGVLRCHMEGGDYNQFLHKEELAGRIPHNPEAQERAEEKVAEVGALIDSLALPLSAIDQVELEVSSTGLTVATTLNQYIDSGSNGDSDGISDTTQILEIRVGKLRVKDQLKLYLQGLIASIVTNKPVIATTYFLDAKNRKPQRFQLQFSHSKQTAQECLDKFILTWQEGQQGPLSVHAELGLALKESGNPASSPTEQLHAYVEDWYQNLTTSNWGDTDVLKSAFAGPPYLRWFFPQAPTLTKEHWLNLWDLYSDFISHLQQQEEAANDK